MKKYANVFFDIFYPIHSVFKQLPLIDSKICMQCENTLLKFRKMERKLKSIYGKNVQASSSKESVQSPVQELPNAQTPAIKRSKTDEQPPREIGSGIQYLNKFSNKVETGTYLGLKGEKIKCCIKKGQRQHFIYIDEDHIV